MENSASNEENTPVRQTKPVKKPAGFEMTLLTAIISIVIYGWFLGPALAFWFVLLIFAHEMGHYIMAKIEKIDASVPYFIPFLGAVINMRRMPDHAWSEAKMGLAGPVAGLLATALLLPVAGSFGSLPEALFLSVIVNLFNLIPVSPLDGGRAASVLHPIFWALGWLTLVAAAIYMFNSFIIWFIIAIAGMEVYTRTKERMSKDPKVLAYYETSWKRKGIVILTYLLLIAAGLLLMDYLLGTYNINL